MRACFGWWFADGGCWLTDDGSRLTDSGEWSAPPLPPDSPPADSSLAQCSVGGTFFKRYPKVRMIVAPTEPSKMPQVDHVTRETWDCTAEEIVALHGDSVEDKLDDSGNGKRGREAGWLDYLLQHLFHYNQYDVCSATFRGVSQSFGWSKG